jgi:two-component system, NarL family, response regulator NreC
MKPTIRVLVVDDHAVLRAGLRMLIGAQVDMDVVAEAADGEEAVRKAVESRPDVVLMDLTMPGGGGVRVIERLRQECPSSRVLVLTMHDVPAYLRSALAAGAVGYVVKSAADSELLSAIRAVYRGRTVLDPELAASVLQNAVGRRPASGPGAGLLSPREREVLDLIARGYTNQQIADRFGLSVKTIETHRSRLVEKLGLRSRAELVRYALDSGLFTGVDAVLGEPPPA